MRRAVRWTLRIALALGAVIALAIIALVIALHTTWGRDQLRAQIEAQLAGAFVGGATLGRVDGSPFGTLVLEDVVIAGPDRAPMISIRHLEIKLALLPLLSRDVVVRSVVADGVDLRLVHDATGDMAASHMLKPGPPTTWSVVVKRIAIRHGRVVFEVGDHAVELDDVRLDGRVSVPAGAPPIEASARVDATWREPQVPVVLAAAIRDSDDELAIPAAVARVGDAQLAAANLRIPAPPPASGPPVSGAIARATLRQPSGIVAIAAPALALDRLVPGARLPIDAALAIDASGDGAIALAGSFDRAPVRGLLRTDLAARSATGVLTAAAVPVDRLGVGLAGTAGVLAAVSVERASSARGVVAVWGDLAGLPHAAAVIGLEATADQLHASIGAGSAGTSAGIDAVVARRGAAIDLSRATVVATAHDARRATADRVSMRGAVRARLSAHGALAPAPALAIAGTVDGDRLAIDDLAIGRLRLAIDATGVPSHPAGRATLDLDDVERAGVPLGALTATIAGRRDGRLAVSLRSTPRQAPWQIDVDALVAVGETIAVDLVHHAVRAANRNVWTGSGGRLVISPREIALTGFASASSDGRVAASGSYVRSGRGAGDLTAKLDGVLDAKALGQGRCGQLELAVDAERRGGRWTGTAHAKATGIARPGGTAPLDGEVTLEAKPGRLTGELTASSRQIGTARVAVDVDAPEDVSDVRAWRRLDRRALRELALTLHGVDLAALAEPLGLPGAIAGRVEGAITLTASDVTGALAVGGVSMGDLTGTIDAQIKFHAEGDAIAAVTAVGVPRLGTLELAASFVPPVHVFDPAAWVRLDAKALRSAAVRAHDLALEAALARLGVETDLRGRLGLSLETDSGLRDVRLHVDLDDVRGEGLVQPVAVDIAAEIDQTRARGRLSVHADDLTLVAIEGEAAVTLNQLRAHPRALLAAPLHAELTIPAVPAPRLFAVVGNPLITGGTIDGHAALAGTVARPTGEAQIVATGISVPLAGGGFQPQSIRKLELRATWDGRGGRLVVHGDESRGTLDLVVGGQPEHASAITASLTAHELDLAPLVAFLPGPASGIAGTLDARLDMVGADPRTAQVSGTVDITDGRLPISPEIGTLFHAKVHAGIDRRALQITAGGNLGKGTVSVSGAVPLAGAVPSGGKLTAELRNVQLIGATEPVISSDVTVELSRANRTWRAIVGLRHTTVRVPDAKGERLAPIGIPDDISFGPRRRRPAPIPGGAPPPLSPALMAAIDLGSVEVTSKELRGTVTGRLRVRVGGRDDGLGVIGNVSVVRGDLDLFDRRYLVDRAVLSFDGTTDPLLDIRITYDFPEVTTVTEVHGRLSRPDLTLSSSPGTYSQSELLGFLLGGEPGGDPSTASAQEKVTSAGASLIANQVGGYVKRALPVAIDVLRYEAATATTSAAVTVGTWLSRSLFLAYRQRLEARPDENTSEAQVEYWLRRRLMLQGTIGDRGYSGLDLLWRRRW